MLTVAISSVLEMPSTKALLSVCNLYLFRRAGAHPEFAISFGSPV